MDLITIKISGHALLSILDFFDEHRPLPPVIQEVNESLRLQFASGIFNMKVDQYKEDYGYGAEVKIETSPGEETSTTAATETNTEEAEETEGVTDKQRPRTAKSRRRRIVKKWCSKTGRHSVSGETEDIWGPDPIQDSEGSSEEGWEDSDDDRVE